MFYDQFMKMCKERGITAYKFSQDSGIGQSTISMWKKNGATPSGDTLAKIAEYFNVSIDFLLTGEEQNKNSPASSEGSNAESFAHKLFAAHKDIAPEDYDEDDMDDIATFMRMIKKRKNDDE